MKCPNCDSSQSITVGATNDVSATYRHGELVELDHGSDPIRLHPQDPAQCNECDWTGTYTELED
jgi:hypothetical protein